jgi:hypothetical protein
VLWRCVSRSGRAPALLNFLRANHGRAACSETLRLLAACFVDEQYLLRCKITEACTRWPIQTVSGTDPHHSRHTLAVQTPGQIGVGIERDARSCCRDGDAPT